MKMPALAVLAASLAGCAVPYHAINAPDPFSCLVVDSAGFIYDRNCTAFELSWLPGARRLTVGARGPDEIDILEVSGRHRQVTVRRVREGYYCELSRDYPRPRPTRNCRTTEPVHPPLSVRG